MSLDYPLEKYSVQLLLDAIRERATATRVCERRLARMADHYDPDPLARKTLRGTYPVAWATVMTTVGAQRRNNRAWIREYAADRRGLLAELRTRKDGPALIEQLDRLDPTHLSHRHTDAVPV